MQKREFGRPRCAASNATGSRPEARRRALYACGDGVSVEREYPGAILIFVGTLMGLLSIIGWCLI